MRCPPADFVQVAHGSASGVLRQMRVSSHRQGRGAGGSCRHGIYRGHSERFSGRSSGSSMVMRSSGSLGADNTRRYGHRLIGRVLRVLSWRFGSIKQGWNCPFEARAAVGAPAPLQHLSVRWRVLTLVILGDLFGEADGSNGTMPEAAARLFRRAAPIPRAPYGRRAAISKGEDPIRHRHKTSPEIEQEPSPPMEWKLRGREG